MLTFLSPAKNMRDCAAAQVLVDTPRFLAQAGRLASQLKSYSAWQLESLLGVNPTLAMRAFLNYREFDITKPGAPALLAFHGLAYQRLNAADMALDELRYAHAHIRVLSAFYGVLRALDGIQPYRLDFHSRVRIENQSLYQFWGDTLYHSLFDSGEPVVNLASAEYARAVRGYVTPRDHMVTCEFLTMRGGKRRTLPTAAKMARGSMVRWIVKERVDVPERLRDFEYEGYAFCKGLSTRNTFVFMDNQKK